MPFPATTFPYLKSIPHKCTNLTNVRLMFPQHHFHQEIVLLKNKHNKLYILTVYKIIKLKHFDLIFKILQNRIQIFGPIFGPILPSTNHMQQGSFTQTKHTRHTLISISSFFYLNPTSLWMNLWKRPSSKPLP